MNITSLSKMKCPKTFILMPQLRGKQIKMDLSNGKDQLDHKETEGKPRLTILCYNRMKYSRLGSHATTTTT